MMNLTPTDSITILGCAVLIAVIFLAWMMNEYDYKKMDGTKHKELDLEIAKEITEQARIRQTERRARDGATGI